MDTNKKNRFVNMLLLTGCALLAVIADFFPFLLVVLPGFIASCIAKNEKPSLAAAVICLGPVLALAVLYGVNSSLLCALPPVVLASVGGTLIYYLQKKKIGGFETVFYASILMGAMLYLSITLPGILSGEGAFTSVKNTATQIVEILSEFMTSGAQSSSAVEEAAEFVEMIKPLPGFIVSMIVPYCCVTAGFLALGNFLFFRLFVKKRREELGLNPIKPFRMWSVPYSFLYGICVLFFSSLVLLITGSESADSVLVTCAFVFGFPFCVQGLALIDWLLVKRNAPDKLKKKRILVYILIGIFFQFILNLLVALGGLEEFLHFRERVVVLRRPGGKGGIPNPFRPHKPEDGGSDTEGNHENNPEDKHSEEK